MIPICRDPKRFVAALNKHRFNPATIVAAHINVASVTNVQVRAFSVHNNNFNNFSTAVKMDPFAEEIKVMRNTIKKTILEEGVPAPSYTASLFKLNLHGPRESNWFTGKQPVHGQCPGVGKDNKIRSLPQVTFHNLTKQKLQDYFDNTWTMTEVLLASLQGEETFMRPPYHDLRHPMIFYYGHPAVLYVNKLRVAGLINKPINPYFESIFETGVDEMSWDDLSKNKMPWPSVAEVHAYRRQVYTVVSNLIQSLSVEQCATVNQSSPLWALVMAFEHERIHIETSSFLINELPTSSVRFPEGFPKYHPSIPKAQEGTINPVAGQHYPVNEMLPIPAQHVTIGKSRDFPSYGWDNEYGQRSFDVPAFQASKFKITNGEYLEFVKEGGYAKREYWTETGWKWRAFRNVKWPVMWQRRGPQGHHEYELRLIFDEVTMPWDWPVCVNYHEAAAFTKWKSVKSGKKYRVITELEHRAIRGISTEQLHDVSSDHAAVLSGNDCEKMGYNTNLAYSSMSPVTAYQPNSLGFHDVFGNAWEWTEDYFCALPGFEVHPYYEDFSTPCFDGLHHVIQGGSFMSTGNEASIHSRFHFRPHFHQHASFRVVEQLNERILTSDTDAPAPYVGSYPFRRTEGHALEEANNQHKLNFQTLVSMHYGSTIFTVLNNMHNLASKLITSIETHGDESIRKHGQKVKVLEVGCGVGGVTTKLAEKFGTVIGIDHHQENIQFAKDLIETGSAKYQLRKAGEIMQENTVTLPASTNLKQQLQFRCADPMCLPAEMMGFDVVILNDVIDKVSSPNSVLGRMGGVRGLVRDRGVLVVVSSYQWQENTTPKSLWLGGYTSSDGTVVDSEDTLITRLQAQDFTVKSRTLFPLFWQTSDSTVQGRSFKVTVFVKEPST